MSRLFIDPSINSMGLALWKNKTWSKKKDGDMPDYFALVKSGNNLNNLNWEKRAAIQALAVIDWLKSKPFPQYVYIEKPSFFGTTRGLVSAQSDSLVKLSVMVGCLIMAFTERGSGIILLDINAWKGQLPKKIVMDRIRKVLWGKPYQTFKDDVWDAVGMGLYCRGKL